MNIPNNLKYSKEHEWVKIDGTTAIIGISEFAQSELGDIVFIEIDSLGTPLKKDDVFGTIEAVKTVSDLFMPIDGKIIEINPKLEDQPELINTDPYGDGWLVKATFSNLNDLDDLLDSEAYKKMVEA